ncbi:hypothetical protein RQM59_04700 [Flavobacteriaceae bacterium S356]|uniref:Transcriptional regulator n=1 Tax=Asprobacillus argus TaxID=3076534 RepID=A0ABU3LD82_9FLAO|nr:hypothetical protein [Flavobacteriaceae bacterium S356]
MKQANFTNRELSVLSALNKEHLTTFQLLKRMDSVPMILKLYTILDELKEKGVVKSYMKKDTKYHYAA